MQKCEICRYCENESSLDIHHKDWDHENNNIENLQIICSNCHRKLRYIKKQKTKRRDPIYKIIEENRYLMFELKETKNLLNILKHPLQEKISLKPRSLSLWAKELEDLNIFR